MPEGIAETDAEKQDPRLASRNLVADFPEMFADAFDVSVPNGWYSVVWECCSAIHEVAPETHCAGEGEVRWPSDLLGYGID
jgi:hypothetical protein